MVAALPAPCQCGDYKVELLTRATYSERLAPNVPQSWRKLVIISNHATPAGNKDARSGHAMPEIRTPIASSGTELTSPGSYS